MKKIKYIFILTLLALLSCTQDDSGMLYDEHIYFSVFSTETRAYADLSNILTEGFRVWGGYDEEVVFNGDEIIPGNVSYCGTNKYWTDNTYHFFAVYPRSIDANYTHLPGSISISNCNVKDNQDDIMIATTTTNDEHLGQHIYPDDGRIVDLYFRHALSAATFSITLSDAVENPHSTYKIKKISIGDVYTSGDIEVDNNLQLTTTATGSKSAMNDITEFSGTHFTKEISMTSAPIIVMPQNGTTSLRLEYEVNGHTIVMDKNDFTIAWEVGKKHNYNIKFDPNRDVTIIVTTTEWDEPTIPEIEIL